MTREVQINNLFFNNYGDVELGKVNIQSQDGEAFGTLTISDGKGKEVGIELELYFDLYCETNDFNDVDLVEVFGDLRVIYMIHGYDYAVLDSDFGIGNSTESFKIIKEAMKPLLKSYKADINELLKDRF